MGACGIVHCSSGIVVGCGMGVSIKATRLTVSKKCESEKCHKTFLVNPIYRYAVIIL